MLAGGSKNALVYKLNWTANRSLEAVRASRDARHAVDRLRSRRRRTRYRRSCADEERIRDAGSCSVARNIRRGGARAGARHRKSRSGRPDLIDGGSRALVALTFDDELAIVDRATGAASKIRTGIAPFGVAVNAANTVAYVTTGAGDSPRRMIAPQRRGTTSTQTTSSSMRAASLPAGPSPASTSRRTK